MLRLPYLRITPAIAAVSLYITCSLAIVFKQFTSVRPNSVKNSPSPTPTTSSATCSKALLLLFCFARTFDYSYFNRCLTVLYFSDIYKHFLPQFVILYNVT